MRMHQSWSKTEKAAASIAVLASCVAALLAVSCGRDNSTPVTVNSGTTSGVRTVELASCPSGSADIIMQNETFIPGRITVPVNATVKWTNADVDVNYWVISGDVPVNGDFRTPVVSPGNSICLTFKAPGEYHYHCDPTVTGVVVVTP